MRIIKYRAYDKKAGKMIYPKEISYFDINGIEHAGYRTIFVDILGNVLIYLHSTGGTEKVEFLENAIPMEYIGLKDKNGKEIYEGDVIKESFGKNFEVVFWEGCFCYKTDEKHGQIFNPKDVEVIGNIFENSELLKKEEKNEKE